MPYADDSRDPLILAFVALVRGRWPDLLDHARLEPNDTLRFEIPGPRAEASEPLVIIVSADDDEVSIGFAFSHVHCGGWEAPGYPDFEFKSSVELIEGIFDETIVSCLYPTHRSLSSLAELKARDDWATVIKVRSWRGAHDRG